MWAGGSNPLENIRRKPAILMIAGFCVFGYVDMEFAKITTDKTR